MKKKIKVGDVVQLQSDGPLMTVDHIRDDAERGKLATCVWFSPWSDGAEGWVHCTSRDTFALAALYRVPLDEVGTPAASTPGD